MAIVGAIGQLSISLEQLKPRAWNHPCVNRLKSIQLNFEPCIRPIKPVNYQFSNHRVHNKILKSNKCALKFL